MDPARAQIGMSEAQANLARVVRSVRAPLTAPIPIRRNWRRRRCSWRRPTMTISGGNRRWPARSTREEVAHARDLGRRGGSRRSMRHAAA